MGRRSLCTPSLEMSGPETPCLPATLSISSMKMIPEFSVLSRARATTLSMSISLRDSSSMRISMASGTFTFFFFDFFGSRFPIISDMPGSISSTPAWLNTWMGRFLAVTSTSTSLSSSFPAHRSLRSFILVAAFSSSVSVPGRRRSIILSSAISFALVSTASVSSSVTMFTAISVRSRIMDSTSRPT